MVGSDDMFLLKWSLVLGTFVTFRDFYVRFVQLARWLVEDHGDPRYNLPQKIRALLCDY